MKKKLKKKATRFNRLTHVDPDVTQVSQRLIVTMSGWSQGTVSKLEGIPRNADESYNALETMPFIISVAEKRNKKDTGDLEKEKLRLQCEKLTLDQDRMKSEMIPVEDHQQIFAARATSLKNYIVEFFDKNVHLFAHKSVEQLRPFLRDAAAAMLNNYVSNHK